MAINIFIFAILIFSAILTNYKVEHKKVQVEYKNVPLIVFENSIMYDLDTQNIKQIVQSRQALNYKDRDELYDATIINRNKNNSTDSLSAEYILKQNNIYKMYQNVHLIQNDVSELSTDYLEFNNLTKVAKNNTDFVMIYNNSELVGDNLYYDSVNSIIKAKHTHFKLKLQRKEN